MLGRMEQLAGIREYVIENGPGEGVKAAEVYTGSGLRFTVLKSRGMDIADCWYKGIPLAWQGAPGITAPTQGYNRSHEFMRGFYGGLLLTCGLSNTGQPTRFNGEEMGLHGRYTNLQARMEEVIQAWRGDTYVLELVGNIRESRVFGPNLIMQRRISTSLMSSSLEVSDVVINWTDVAVPHAMAYHMNFGYPLLAPGAELVYNQLHYEPHGATVRKPETCDWKTILPPSSMHFGSREDFTYIVPRVDASGTARCGIVNNELELAVMIEYSAKRMPRLGSWLHYGGYGCYVAALEPMTSGMSGHDDDKRRGWYSELAPEESREYWVKVSVLEGAQRIKELRDAVDRIGEA